MKAGTVKNVIMQINKTKHLPDVFFLKNRLKLLNKIIKTVMNPNSTVEVKITDCTSATLIGEAVELSKRV